MAEQPKQKIGSIGWHDLTVPDADGVRDFYQAVAGWTPEPLDMGGYSDYVMKPAEGDPTGGICHARGSNTDIPPVWMMYIVVADIAASAKNVTELGGKILKGPTGGTHNFCVIQDPAGAICALYQG
jgi:predicted enzyme related to lactoylglutathione lyase